MEVDLTDQLLHETGPTQKEREVELDVRDLAPLGFDRAADGTRSKLTAAPPPVPRTRTSTLPPPLPARAARGSVTPKLVAPKATPEMMAAWQVNPEAPLRDVGDDTRAKIAAALPLRTKPASVPPPIPAAAKSKIIAAVEPPPSASALPTTIELVRAPEIVKPAAQPEALAVTGNAPELIPGPRESRVAPMPTIQPGADVADLPQWPIVDKPPAGPRPSARMATPAVASDKPASALDGSDGWVFEEDYEERQVDGEVVPTTYFEREEVPEKKSKRYLIAIGAAAAAVAAIVAIVMHGGSTETTKPVVAAAPAPIVPAPVAVPVVPAPAPVAAEPAPAPVAAAPVAPAAPALVTLPITSWPTGAVITLVDNGNATVLGPTPVNAALDPTHSYDVVFAVVGRPTTVKHVDLATMHELAVDLDPDPAAAPAAKPAEHHHHHHEQVASSDSPAKAAPVSVPKAQPAVAKSKQVAIATPAATGSGDGILMVSAKPPCEIIVDGKPTHLMTPQRSISLAPGAHQITLVNAQIGIRKTVAVKVEAKQPTKLIKDFTKG